MELLRALASWVTTGVVTLGAAAGIVLSNIGPSPSTPIAQAPTVSPSRVASTPHVAHRTSSAVSWPSNAPSIHVAALSVKGTTPGASPVVAETPSTTEPVETMTVPATVPTTSPPTTQPPSFVAPVAVSTPPPVVITTTTAPQRDDGGSDD